MLVLDSSVIIEYLRKGPRISALLEKMNDESLVTTSITIHELMLSGSEEERWKIEQLIPLFEVLPHTSVAALEGSRVARLMKSKRLNPADEYIAGICLANKATIVTFDQDFKRVPGLKTLGI